MRNRIIKAILILFVVFILIILFARMLLDNGIDNQKEYCNKFIPNLEHYYKKHNEYPESLMAFGGKAHFNFRYSANRCQYECVDKGYTFSVTYGLTFENYESWTKTWRYD